MLDVPAEAQAAAPPEGAVELIEGSLRRCCEPGAPDEATEHGGGIEPGAALLAFAWFPRCPPPPPPPPEGEKLLDRLSAITEFSFSPSVIPDVLQLSGQSA